VRGLLVRGLPDDDDFRRGSIALYYCPLADCFPEVAALRQFLQAKQHEFFTALQLALLDEKVAGVQQQHAARDSDWQGRTRPSRL